MTINLLGTRVVDTAQGQTVRFLNLVTNGGLIKNSSGSLVLANDTNDFTGGVRVTGGTLIFTSIADSGMTSALGSSGVIELTAGGNVTANKRALQFGGGGFTVSADATSNRQITLTGNDSYALYYLSNQTNHKLTLTGDFINAATGTGVKTLIVSGVKGAVTELAGVIGNASASGVTGVTTAGEAGAGTPFAVRLTGTANTFSGAVTIGYNTTLTVTKLANQGEASSLGTGLDTPVITIGGTGSDYGSSLIYIGADDATTDRLLAFQFRRNSTNSIANNSPTNANLSFTGSSVLAVNKSSGDLAPHTLALQGSSTGTSTLAGGIVDYIVETTSANSEDSPDMTETRRDKTSLTVNSSGVWRLTGASAFTGSTTVSGGTLLVDGALAGTVAVTVGASATLGGFGTINSAATLTVSGNLAPGAVGEIGTLTVGALTLNAGATLTVDVNSDTLMADLLRATGPVNLGNGTATLSAGLDLGSASLTAGERFTILQTDAALSGRFANDELLLGDNLFQIGYDLGHGEVFLLSIPEPSVPLTVLLGTATITLIMSMRKKRR